MTLIFRRGRELYGFEVDLYNIPGVLAAVTSVASDYKLNIYYIEIISYTENVYSLYLVLDFTGTKITAPQVEKEMREKTKYVKNVSVSPVYKDVIFPSRFSHYILD